MYQSKRVKIVALLFLIAILTVISVFSLGQPRILFPNQQKAFQFPQNVSVNSIEWKEEVRVQIPPNFESYDFYNSELVNFRLIALASKFFKDFSGDLIQSSEKFKIYSINRNHPQGKNLKFTNLVLSNQGKLYVAKTSAKRDKLKLLFDFHDSFYFKNTQKLLAFSAKDIAVVSDDKKFISFPNLESTITIVFHSKKAKKIYPIATELVVPNYLNRSVQYNEKIGISSIDTSSSSTSSVFFSTYTKSQGSNSSEISNSLSSANSRTITQSSSISYNSNSSNSSISNSPFEFVNQGEFSVETNPVINILFNSSLISDLDIPFGFSATKLDVGGLSIGSPIQLLPSQYKSVHELRTDSLGTVTYALDGFKSLAIGDYQIAASHPSVDNYIATQKVTKKAIETSSSSASSSAQSCLCKSMTVDDLIGKNATSFKRKTTPIQNVPNQRPFAIRTEIEGNPDLCREYQKIKANVDYTFKDGSVVSFYPTDKGINTYLSYQQIQAHNRKFTNLFRHIHAAPFYGNLKVDDNYKSEEESQIFGVNKSHQGPNNSVEWLDAPGLKISRSPNIVRASYHAEFESAVLPGCLCIISVHIVWENGNLTRNDISSNCSI